MQMAPEGKITERPKESIGLYQGLNSSQYVAKASWELLHSSHTLSNARENPPASKTLFCDIQQGRLAWNNTLMMLCLDHEQGPDAWTFLAFCRSYFSFPCFVCGKGCCVFSCWEEMLSSQEKGDASRESAQTKKWDQESGGKSAQQVHRNQRIIEQFEMEGTLKSHLV